MPRGDGTGPNGAGSRTGRGLGNCPPGTGSNVGAVAGRGLGLGARRGMGLMAGFGLGMGLRRGFGRFWNNQPAESELDTLKSQASFLEEELAGIKDRISQLEQE